MKNKINLMILTLMLISTFAFGQRTSEVRYKLFVQPDSVEVPESKLNIGTEKWDQVLNIQKKWTGTAWVYDDAVIFRDNGFGFASIDRDATNMAPIGDYAFDISTNWYRVDGPGAVGEISFCQGTDNKAAGYASVVFGYNNSALSNYSFVAGVDNITGGGGGAMVLGNGLSSDGSQAILVGGSYNIAPKDLGDGADSHRLIIGIGASAGAKKNGFEVKLDGEVEAASLTNILIAAANSGTVLVTRDFVAGSIPASATAAGSKGQIATDATHIYVCTATNTWKRIAIATW